MGNRKIGYWKYFFGGRGKYVMYFSLLITVISVGQQLYEGSDEWWMGLFFLLGVPLVLGGTWMNYIQEILCQNSNS